MLKLFYITFTALFLSSCSSFEEKTGCGTSPEVKRTEDANGVLIETSPNKCGQDIRGLVAVVGLVAGMYVISEAVSEE